MIVSSSSRLRATKTVSDDGFESVPAAIAAFGKKQLVSSIERAAAWSSGSGPPEGRRSSRGGQLPVRSGDPPADSGGVRNPSPSARLSWVRRWKLVSSVGDLMWYRHSPTLEEVRRRRSLCPQASASYRVLGR